MRKKVLFCATVDSHFESFHLPYLKWFKEQGWEVHVAAGGNLALPYVDKTFRLSIQRSPFSLKNIKAYKELSEIINHNQYQIIHCHTPMGGVITRLAAKAARNLGTNVIYTAHGFHFFKGAPFINWAFYYPIEKYLSNLTDCLITINQEDYQIALKKQFQAKHIMHVHGVGIDTEVFFPVSRFHKLVLRGELGYTQQDFLLFYAAEFNKNKNQQFLIRALPIMKKEIPNMKLLLAGDGPLLEACRKIAFQLEVDDMVHFLGYRKDIDKLLKMSDLAVASSFREGLPVNIMEAMACGLPVVATINRGHKELIETGVNGYLLDPQNIQAFALRILDLYQSHNLYRKMGIESHRKIEKYSLPIVSSKLVDIYSQFMVEEADETQSKRNRAYI